VCHCHRDKPCDSSCGRVQVATLDKQLPPRTTGAQAAVQAHLLFLSVGIAFNYPAFVSVVRHRDVNASPPFGGRPPQALLRLWLI
jgi:hypothetical protein